MKLHNTRIPGCHVVEYRQHNDYRGTFEEAFNMATAINAGLTAKFLQDNVSISFKNVLRGLHLQRFNPQGKLVRCFGGEIFDVCVDLRKDSPTLGQWEAVHLSWEKPVGFYIPPGCAHGYYVTGEAAMVYYKCTTLYHAESDAGIHWNDPKIGIQWPMKVGTEPVVSPRDQALPSLDDYLKAQG